MERQAKRPYSLKTPSPLVSSLIVAHFLLTPAMPSLAQDDGVPNIKKTNMDTPNAPMVADLAISEDATPELVLTDVRGRLKIFNAITLEELDSLNFEEGALTAPVVGDFTGDNFLEVAVATYSGRVMILSGATLDVIATINVPAACSLQPTVVPGLKPGEKDLLVVADRDGTIHGFRLSDAMAMESVFKYETSSTISSPMVVGSVRREGVREIVAGTGGGEVALVAIDNSLPPIKPLILQSASIAGSPLLVDLNADGRDEVVVALSRGEIRTRTYLSNEERFADFWQGGARQFDSPPVGSPTLIEYGMANRFIILASESYFHVYKASDGEEVAAQKTGLDGIGTQMAVIPRANGLPEVAFGLKRTIQITNGLGNWILGGGTTNLQTTSVEINRRLTTTMVTAFDSDTSAAYVIGASPEEEGLLISTKTDYVVPISMWPTRSSWMTQGGTPYHNPVLTQQTRNFHTSLLNKREAIVSQAAIWRNSLETAMEEGNWEEARSLVNQLMKVDPFNEEFQSTKFRITVRSNIVMIVGSIVFGVIVICVAGFQTFRIMTRRNLRLRGETAVSRGEFDQAKLFYEKLYAKMPNNPKVVTALAKVYMSLRDQSEHTIDVFRKAHAANPQSKDILNALASALLVEPRSTPEAKAIFEKAINGYPEPHWLEYGIGRCELKAGQYEEAGKRLRSALRGGVTTDDLYRALCDVYINTKNFTAKALPVFEQQYASRREESEFLQGYLLACIDAKKVDGKIESLCQSVLEVSPNFVPAFLHLAQTLLQKNQMGAAIDEIQQALAVEPSNPQAVAMLATAFLMQNRKDEEALQAYENALRVNPNNEEVLKALTTIYLEKSQFNGEAIAIYNRTLEVSPKDINALRALAQVAALTNDANLSIRVIETLAEAGQINQKLMIQLARAYVEKDVRDEKAERIIREALRHEPNDEHMLSALARLYCTLDRNNVEITPILESHIQRQPNDIAAARQLTKAYIKAERFEKALETTKHFLQLAPEDEDLQRLNAQASLYDNKIDEAIAEYKRLLARNANDKDALVNLALAFGQKIRVDQEAYHIYQQALSIQPNNDMLHLAAARYYISKNDVVQAVASYKAALGARENNDQVVMEAIEAVLLEHPEMLRLRWHLVEVQFEHHRLRDSLEQIEYISQNHPGQTNNILRAVETILQKDGNNTRALLLHGSMLNANNQHDLAIKSLEKAFKLQPNDAEVQENLILVYTALLEKKDSPDVRFKLGNVFYNQQEYDAAIGCFQNTAQDYRWEAESTKMLGRCFSGKGMLDLALQEFKKLVVDVETKELLYDLAQRYEGKKDLVGAKTVYRQLFAADIGYKDVKQRFEMLSGSTSDPMAFEKTSIVEQMSEEAARRYELLDELGRGAMGIVYRARDKELDEVVALKILPDNMSNNPEAVRRFKIEARNARKLSHPNIVRIHDIGEEMGRKYISMEYVDGSDLKKHMKSAPDFKLPIGEIIRYAAQCADALAYAHRLGIVHRDIKPANIMLTSQNEVKITDFGIAKLLDADGGGGEGTMIGAVIGTPLYMSPEQVQGIPVDNRADLYSFGVMVYELLNGRPPFTEGDLAYQHIHREPDPIEGLDEELWGIVAKCLAKSKEQRWDKAEVIFETLKDYAKRHDFNIV